MKIEEVLHLFTKVEDGLPEQNGHYLCIKTNKTYGDHFIGIQFEKHQGFLSGSVITHWLDLSKLTTKSLPDPYSGTLNEKRIQAYHKIADMYTCSPSSVRDIFCAGIDWYKSELEKL